jgi:hypothetical protein
MTQKRRKPADAQPQADVRNEHDDQPPGGHDPGGHDPGGGDQGGDEGLAGPRLFIPWGVLDDGVRGPASSVPPWVVSYLWPGVRTRLPDGTPYTGGDLPRNQASTVVVDVANSGNDGVWAEVSLFWTDPSAGFAPPFLHRAPELGSPAGVFVPAHSTVPAPAITLRPGPMTPSHFCLIAVVNGVGSAADHSWDPLADGHYAQHNLDILELGGGKSAAFPVHLVNPFTTDAVVDVMIRAATVEQLRWFADRYRAEPRRLPVDALGLLVVDGPAAEEPRRALRLDLAGRERRVCHGFVAGDGIGSGEFSVVEVVTSTRPRDDEMGRQAIQGSFGMVVFGSR